MTANRTVDADRFAVALDAIFGSIDRTLSDELDVPVEHACKAARNKAKSKLKKHHGVLTGKYKAGMAYKVDRTGRYESYGYVGNRKKPGLVHLLEKGHATMNGGRTRRIVHMEDGADEGKRVLVEEAEKLVDRALA